jgi:hypothetical protein
MNVDCVLEAIETKILLLHATQLNCYVDNSDPSPDEIVTEDYLGRQIVNWMTIYDAIVKESGRW